MRRTLGEFAGDWLLILRLAHAHNCCDDEGVRRLRLAMERRELARAMARAGLR